MFVEERYVLGPEVVSGLKAQRPQFGFGQLGASVYYRTYSRTMENGQQEQWADTVTRVVNGVMSIRKDWYTKHRLPWDQTFWDRVAVKMADAIYNFRFTPPGRGLWAMGTDYVYERGALALNNCQARNIDILSRDASLIMDSLMCGVGVGYSCFGYQPTMMMPTGEPITHVIADSREGWVDSVRALIGSYETGSNPVEFDYSQIRAAGLPIKGFGGTASGYEPLKQLHERLRDYLAAYAMKRTSVTRLVCDVANAIGCCVVAGNVRRSALLYLGSPSDTEFLNLKNYELYPERMEIGWMSNNSIRCEDHNDFAKLGEIAERIRYNGEPGVLNLLNIKQYGRYGEPMLDTARYTNPCVPGTTRVLTGHGYEPIADLVGAPTEIWNGETWSIVVPRVTGHDQPLLKITFNDGTDLTTTPYHAFLLNTGYQKTAPVKVEARELKTGDRLWKHRMPVVEYGEPADPAVAYAQGLYAGDGHLQQGKATINMYGTKQELELPVSTSRTYATRTVVRPVVASTDKRFVPHKWDLACRLAWLAGLADTDGTLTRDGNLQISSIDRDFLRETRLLLTTLGVQAKIGLMHKAAVKALPDGHGGLKDYSCKTSWRLTMTAADTAHLRDLGMPVQRLDLSGVAPNRDAGRYVAVVSVEDAGTAETVYCFNEPLNHTGTFEGIVTGNCAEATLEDAECCNLVEVFPTRCRTAEEFLEACELSAIYASTVSLLPTHQVDTNEVIARNRRIGVSLSGVADWFDTAGATSIVTLMRKGYRTVEITNRLMAKQAGVPESIRKTVIKPSGTVSTLAGVSPGMHWPVYTRYIRRVRVGMDAPIVPVLQEAGIPHEPDEYSANTLVFEFPVEAKAKRAQRDVSIWQKGAMLTLLQRHWADQMVSNTITFDPKTEGNQIEDFLAFTVPLTKSTSLLPDGETASYAQMPYEPITAKEFQFRQEAIKEIDWSQFGGSDGLQETMCDTTGCEVDFSKFKEVS